MEYSTYDSPLGKITLVSDGKFLVQVHIAGDKHFQSVPTGWTKTTESPILKDAAKQLEEYFAGQRRKFDLPLKIVGTDFQKQIWRAIANIPYGQTSTYGQIAQAIDRPRAIRAVGSAIGRNPLCIIVPCHRVVSGDGSLGGYVAGVECKRRLLELENATN